MLLLCAGHTMPEQTVIAWDLETIPDLTAAARMLDLGMATEAEVRDALRAGFPQFPLPVPEFWAEVQHPRRFDNRHG